VKIVWSAEARQELRAIRKFIARDSEFYATRMVARIVERVETTAIQPTRGHPVHEYPEALLREVHEAPYRIIYRVSGDHLFVVTIVHFKKLLNS
jgi:plasmid stabilization system protein ParE